MIGVMISAVLTGCVDASKASADADTATAAFHQEFNAGRFRDIHRRAHVDFQQAVTEDQFDQRLTSYRTQLGTFKPGGRRRGFALSRTRDGALVTLTYRSRFANGSAQEEFSWQLRGGVTKLRQYAVTDIRIATSAPKPAQQTTLGVRLVPIHASPDHLVYLKDYYEERLAVEIEILPALVPDPAAWTAERRQWSAEGLAEQLRQAVGSHDAVVIGITGSDVYLRSSNWQFAFAWRADDRVAVVSYARMDHHRLRRIVGKELGLMLYGLPVNDDPVSPMYRNIGGWPQSNARSLTWGRHREGTRDSLSESIPTATLPLSIAGSSQ